MRKKAGRVSEQPSPIQSHGKITRPATGESSRLAGGDKRKPMRQPAGTEASASTAAARGYVGNPARGSRTGPCLKPRSRVGRHSVLRTLSSPANSRHPLLSLRGRPPAPDVTVAPAPYRSGGPAGLGRPGT